MDVRTERCEDCGDQVPAYDAVHLTVSAKQSRRICTRCFNARMIERMEREGVVSAAAGAKGREVIARRIEG